MTIQLTTLSLKMYATIISSFLFLIPINICSHYKDIFHMNLSALCMGISISNHSHTHFTYDPMQKNIINKIDIILNSFNLVYSYYTAISSERCFLYGTMNAIISCVIFFGSLYGTKNEHYSMFQKCMHVFFHCYTIIMMTHYKYVCIYS